MARSTQRGAAPRSSTVLRSELIERLATRFDARVTTVVGGAGAGKTTLLAQALRSDDDGLDVWYPCSIADRDDDRLLATIVERCAEALDERPPVSEIEPASALDELIVASSPRQICLVLDDVHLLESGTPLETILAILPANGHLLLSGRRLPPLRIARLDARGEVAEIRQDDLMMTNAEIVAFARQRGVDASVLESADGWPAFVELAAQGGGRRPHRYLEQEALQALGDSRRRALAKFAYVGGGDDEIARAVTGMPLDEVIDGLPLVRWTDDHAQLHDLWIDLLDDALTDDDRRAAADAVTNIHFSRGEYDRAIAINTATAQWPRVEDALAGAVRLGIDGGITAGLLSRWIERLPDDVGIGRSDGSSAG